MSEDENFLTRWSRRKRSVDDAVQAPVAHETAALPGSCTEEECYHEEKSRTGETPRAESARRVESEETCKKGEKTAGVEFDLSTLPSVDSIVANTDISAF